MEKDEGEWGEVKYKGMDRNVEKQEYRDKKERTKWETKQEESERKDESVTPFVLFFYASQIFISNTQFWQIHFRVWCYSAKVDLQILLILNVITYHF